jgi:streptogramin lyase
MYWFTATPRAEFIRRAPDGSVQRLGEHATYLDVRWITATSHGEIYFTDDGDLRGVDSEGKVSTLAMNIRGAAGNWVGGVWLDTSMRVYVAVWGARKVKRFDPASGQVDVVARSAVPWGPSGGLVAPNGNLWLLETSETNSVRIRRLSPSGDERVF